MCVPLMGRAREASDEAVDTLAVDTDKSRRLEKLRVSADSLAGTAVGSLPSFAEHFN